MKAWIIDKISDLNRESQPLMLTDIPEPVPEKGEILVKIKACGVCHTEIDEIEGRTPPPEFPVVPGHQVVGIVEESKSEGLKTGERVGVAWIYSACGKCEYCMSGQENLCYEFRATGRDDNGGYAEYMVVPEKLHCIIDTTPVWKTVLAALAFLKPGGRLVINAIRKENVDDQHLKAFDYTEHLWMEKEIKSVANVTSIDVKNFLKAAAEIAIKPSVQLYPFEKANEALMDIKNRKIRGAKVLKI